MKKSITLDVFNEKGVNLGKKKFYTLQKKANIGEWISGYRIKEPPSHLAMLDSGRLTFQHQKLVRIQHYISDESHALTLTLTNLIPCAVFFAVRHCIKATWINDRDQFLAPNKKWEKDTEFQNDSLVFMLFHAQNRISAKEGTNHFIPFSEKDINPQEKFDSHFMQDFIQGKAKQNSSLRGSGEAKQTKKAVQPSLSPEFDDTQDSSFIPTKPLIFSHEAKEVLEAAKALFKHYHKVAKEENGYNVNAAMYDIKAHFQGFNDKGKMNPPQKAKDEAYKEKLGSLNYALKELAKKIEVKVYEYGFLLE